MSAMQNPNSSSKIISPQLFRHLYGQHSAERRGASSPSGSSSARVTPCGQRTSFESRMPRHARGREENHHDNSSREGYYIYDSDRVEVSRAVCGILRDNLPPALKDQTSHEELSLVADAIEDKLHQTALSPRAYCAPSTLEFRITALATAVLIHSDRRGQEKEVVEEEGDRHHRAVDGRRRRDGVSDTCARLSAAARRSLVYCAMVLFSYEKKKLDKKRKRAMMAQRTRTTARGDDDAGYLQQGPAGRNGHAMEDDMSSERAAAVKRLRQIEEEEARLDEYFSQSANLFGKNRDASAGCYQGKHRADNLRLEESRLVQLFPPSA